MPELPEVETVRRGLAPFMEGRAFERVEQRRPDLRFPFPPRFVARLTGARVERLDRRAKYLLAHLSTGEVLIMHLGMTGRFVIEDRTIDPGFVHAASTNEAHAHVVFHLKDGARVTYHDARRFGFMDLVDAEALEDTGPFDLMGPEPLSEDFDGAHLAAAFKDRRQPIKAALLDQRQVAGLGNIYVCEALFRAGISPVRESGRVSRPRLVRLAGEIKTVLSEALESGGSTLRDFAHTDGSLGYFQHRFKVYDREDEPCSGCGGPIRRLVQSGRSTFYCPRCQK